MPPKKSDAKVDASASKAKPAHASYQDMISEAIIALKDRNGSSRQSLKKYVKANNSLSTTSDNMFDMLFNKALKTGVEKGVFEQPKGASGGTKLAKKVAKPAPKKEVEKKPAVKKAVPTKKEPAKKETKEKKPAAKAAVKDKKPAAVKKAAPKKPAVAKKAAAAPAVVDKPTVLTKTKSGRVAKTAAKPAEKKAAPKKKATPKKAAKKADKPAEATAAAA
jgi:histone H1/5